MSLEQIAAVMLLALGHLLLVIRVLNWSHGLGLHLPRHDLIVASVLATLGLASLGGLGWLAFHPWRTWPVAAQVYLVVCAAVALVGLPLATLVRSFRRLPPEITGRESEIDLALEHGPARLIGDGGSSWAHRIPGNHSFRLRCAEWTVTRADLPPALDGLTILHVSDLHFSRAYSRAFFETVADEMLREQADLVLFTGDLVDDDSCIDWIEPVFQRVKGRVGSFATLGNHDLDHQPALIAAALGRAGYTVLEGDWVVIEHRGATVAIGGTWEPWGPRINPATIPAADFRLLLSHTPDLLYKAERWGVDWMFSGHNHGGQVSIPVLGPILMPSRYGRRFDRGFFEVGKTLLHVSQGVGAKHPYRLNSLPELTRLQLHVEQGPPGPRIGPKTGRG